MTQLPFTKLERKRDKNGQWRGGRRPGAGRPKLTAKQKRDRGPAREPHRSRAIVRRYEPQHIVLRTVVELGSFRTKDIFRAINEASFAAYVHEDSFRICEFSIQDFHLHLIVEANDSESLARGMKAFGGAVTKHVNTLISRARKRSTRRLGSVFSDRYFVVALKTPKQVRNTIAYVLNNWRHHGADRGKKWLFDWYSSASSFLYWKEREGLGKLETPSGYFPPVTSWPRTSLLKELWHRKHPLISIYERPGGGTE